MTIDSSVFDDFKAIGTGAGPNEFVIQLIDQYLAEAAARIATLKGALQLQDAPTLRLAAHMLSGASAMIGARRLAAICEEIYTVAARCTLDGAPGLMTDIETEFTLVVQALQAERQLAG